MPGKCIICCLLNRAISGFQACLSEGCGPSMRLPLAANRLSLVGEQQCLSRYLRKPAAIAAWRQHDIRPDWSVFTMIVQKHG